MPAKVRPNLTPATVIEPTAAESERAVLLDAPPPSPADKLLSKVTQAVVGLSIACDQVHEDLESPQVKRDEDTLRSALRDLAMCRVVLRRAAARMGFPITPDEPGAVEKSAAKKRREASRPSEGAWDLGDDE